MPTRLVGPRLAGARLFSRIIVLALVALLLVPLVGCGTASRVVRLDTGEGKPLVYTPRGGEARVELRMGEFKKSLAELARDVRPASNSLQHARRLMFDSLWHEEVYLRWTGRRLELDSEAEVALRAAQEGLEMTSAYGRWCERQGRFRDCLSLLKAGPVLDADGRYALAMELALGSVWNETVDAIKDMASPEAVRATIVSAMALYMTLWSMPEPVSKGLAATLTAGLIAYLGVDTVWSLIQGWRLLVAEADRATTFAELREAGERFGRVMGKNSARVFILLTTAAIGNTAGLVVKGPGLPGAARATVLAETQAGFRWAAVGEVSSVAVSAEGAFTIALAPGAVAMTARTGGTGSPTRSTLEPGQHARESIPARGPGRDFTGAEREAVNEIGRKYGCHTCGTKNPGTKSGDFIPDHQPPSQLAPGQPQRLFPHCKACSLRQGGRGQRGTATKVIGEPMRWISSAGGPLVLIPKVLQPRWQGTCGVPSDYDVACGVEGYVGVIEKAGCQILVLGDEPLQTAVSRLNGRPCLVRWVYAPSPGVAESSVAAMVPIHLRAPLESVAIRIENSPLVLMDAGAPGEHPGDTLELELESGAYRVHVYEFAPARDMKFLVHEFEQHTGS